MQGVVKMRKPGKGCKKTDAHYYWNRSDEHDRYFFKVLTGDFHERLVSFQVQCVSCKFFFLQLHLSSVTICCSDQCQGSKEIWNRKIVISGLPKKIVLSVFDLL